MHISVDLHSHSGHAGGVGEIRLDAVASAMRRKGIDVFGTGDCLQPAWRRELAIILVEEECGLFRLRDGDDSARFILQTEIIITASVPGRRGRNAPHVVVLFPSFSAADAAAKLLEKWNSKLGIGRPFLKCASSKEVAERIGAILEIDDAIEIIPAHVMTPQGIYGCEPHLDSMREFFSDAADSLHAVETGLSADPTLLAMIPELDSFALISNSDCHSDASHRLGREFTTLDASERSYRAIISAIRSRRIVRTAEFNPAEGRYFLTGHRGDKAGHSGVACVFSPEFTPQDKVCPICGKRLTIGVLERALELSRAQGGGREIGSVKSRQEFIHTVPLSEICAYNFGVGNPESKKVLALYEKIVDAFGTEVAFWEADAAEIKRKLYGVVPEKHLANILEVKRGNFTFEPLGFDGLYGKLVIGRTGDWFSVNCPRGID